MKKVLKSVLALGAVFAMGSTHAINVGGVVWNPSSGQDFSSTDSMVETIVNPVIGGTIQGYAIINSINGTQQSTFCPGCELTYAFSGYSISGIDVGTGALTFTGGNIKIYVDNTPNYNNELRSTAVDGVLFLELAGRAHVDGSTGIVGTLHSDPTPTTAGVEGDGRGYLDVVGGLAASYFDTNTFNIIEDLLGTPGLTDFLFTSSFQRFASGFVITDPDTGVEYGLFGSNDLSGDSQVPEPTTLALTGLALLGVALSRRRKA